TALTPAPARIRSASAATAPRIASGPSAAGVGASASPSRRGPAWGPPAPCTSAPRILVPPRSRARTGSGTPAPVRRALAQQAGPLQDRADAVRRLALDRGHRAGHRVGGEDPQLAQSRLEGADAGCGTDLVGGLEDDLEQLRETVLLAAHLLPVARLRCPVHAHVAGRIHVAEPRHGAVGPGQVRAVDDHLV